jgi:hypothetical protein
MRNNFQFRRGEAINRWRSVIGVLVSFDTNPGGLPSVQRSASIASSPARRATADGCCQFASPDNWLWSEL